MSKQKILCVDDNRDNLIVLKATLEEPDVEIITADNGPAALEIIKESGFALAIIDVEMKGMDGFELSKRIKKLEQTKDLPIIFISAAYSDREAKIKGYDSGAVDFITRPFEPYILKSKVKVFLQIDQLVRQLKEKADIERSKNYLENVIQSANEAIVVIGFDSKVIMANTSACQLWSYSKEEIEGLNASILIESDTFQEWLDELSRYEKLKDLSKLYFKEKEVIAYTKFGYKNPAMVSCSPLLDSNNVVSGGVFTATDLTERKYLEKAFWENEEKIRYLTAFAMDGILMMNPKGKICFWNKAATSIFGYSEEEVFGQDLHKLLAPSKYHKEFHGAFPEFVKEGTGNAINKTIELTALRKSGDEFPIELSLSAISINNKWNAIGIVRDISERKKAEQKIIESEAYYRTLIETSPDAILTTDVEGTILFVSKKAYEMLGIPGNEYAIGTSILQWIIPEQHKEVLERIAGIFGGTYSPSLNEYQLIKYNGTPFVCEISSSPFLNSEGNISGLLIVVHDITARKKTEFELIKAKEKAEESDRLKASFIQNISHEIRTPMNAMVGFTELLKEPGQSESDKTLFTENIIESTNQLLTVISDIVEISNISTNLVQCNPVEVSPADVLNDISEKFGEITKEKNLVLKLENSIENIDNNVIADKLLLRKIMNQLVSNAIKFTPSGTITAGCQLMKNHIKFYVKDTGLGIPVEFQSRIFEPFYQVENSISRRYEGTGLGLAITKAYVQLQGGTITVNSAPGTGSEFSFTLPLILHRMQRGYNTFTPNELGENNNSHSRG